MRKEYPPQPQTVIAFCPICGSAAMWHSPDGFTCGETRCREVLQEVIIELQDKVRSLGYRTLGDMVKLVGILEEKIESLREEIDESRGELNLLHEERLKVRDLVLGFLGIDAETNK